MNKLKAQITLLLSPQRPQATGAFAQHKTYSKYVLYPLYELRVSNPEQSFIIHSYESELTNSDVFFQNFVISLIYLTLFVLR